MTEVVVLLQPETAHAILRGTREAGVAELETVLARFGAELRQQHPGVPDPQLQSYFTVSLDSPELAERVAAALRRLDAVEAAYVQPRPHPA